MRMTDGSVVYGGPKRPVDKQVYWVGRVLSTTQTDNNIIAPLTAGQAATFDGLRGNLCVSFTATGSCIFVIYVVPEGLSVPVLGTVPGTSSALGTGLPEKNILWSCALIAGTDTSDDTIEIPIEIKTKRKLMSGDQIHISAKANGSCGNWIAAWSAFLKI